MTPETIEAWLGVARQIANADGPTIIVLLVVGLMSERLVVGKQYRAMVADRDFFRDKVFEVDKGMGGNDV